jgi:protein-tyrosine phosphatase
MKILFVCLGNICRSPIAEGVLKSLVSAHDLDWHIESAGTESFHIGEPPHHNSQLVCKEQGIDISDQRAMKFHASHLKSFDKIYAMATDVYDEIIEICGHKFETKKVSLFLDDLYPNEGKSVKDPWYGNLDGYYDVYHEIKMGCEAILKKNKLTSHN